jgi:glycosyltransferase involved in cell wall biosynthesis
MRILTISTLFPGRNIEGQGVFIRERQRYLPDDAEVEVVRMRPYFPLIGLIRPHLGMGVPRVEEVAGMTVHDVRFLYLPLITKDRDGHRLASSLSRHLRSPKRELPDVLDAHFCYPSGAGAVEVGRAIDRPVVITLRGTLASYADDARRPKLIEALRGADRVISVSAALAETARDLAGSDLAVRVIPNGVHTARFCPGDSAAARRQLDLPQTARILLTVGGLVPRKGVHRVLEVLPEILKQHPDLLYLVVGGRSAEGNDERRTKRLIRELGLEKNVRLTGAISHDDLHLWYQAADIFVLPTSNEGWANVLHESLATGTPVVTTDVGGNREVVGDDAFGTLVPFGDASALREGIGAAIEKSWDTQAISEWGGRRTWQDVGHEVMSVYREVVGDT